MFNCGVIRSSRRNAGGTTYATTQQLALLSFMVVCAQSWVGNVHVCHSKLRQECSSKNDFLPSNTFCRRSSFLRLTDDASNINVTGESDPLQNDQSTSLQWQLFAKHHACWKLDNDSLLNQTTSWVGKWSTYDYVGDVILETIPASVNYKSHTSSSLASFSSLDKVDVTHTISTGSARSDCKTCFDDPNSIRTIPITTYTPQNIVGKSRLGACGMVVGPSIIRSSGTMATELILAHTTTRIRVVSQHAPVWTRGTEPGSCPPQGLKLIRCLVARETLATPSSNSVVESMSQVSMPGTGQHPIFDRSVPPFDWHKKWSGSSWTWGPEAGDRGWDIPELEIGVDDWHGCAPVEAWNLRLPGGSFIQLPRVVTGDAIERCRLAWMPNADTLLRLEAGVMALQPVFDVDAESIIGFEPPTLASLRCDVLKNLGDLEGVPSFVQQENQALDLGEHDSSVDDTEAHEQLQSVPTNVEDISKASKTEDDDELKRRAIHDAIQL